MKRSSGIAAKGVPVLRRYALDEQTSKVIEERRNHVLRVWERLRGLYAIPKRPEGLLLDGLVRVLLSQNTSDYNSEAAFARLKERFQSWEEVEGASLEELEEAIRPAGISRIRASRMKEILTVVRDTRKSLDLEFLRELDPESAMGFLLSLPGIGIKSASVLLLFYLGHPYFPVDTHVYRTGRRLGVIPTHLDAERAHVFMNRVVPDGLKYQLHMALVMHGRSICRARYPRCFECVLEDICKKEGLVKRS